jgi:hypothetical protein
MHVVFMVEGVSPELHAEDLESIPREGEFVRIRGDRYRVDRVEWIFYPETRGSARRVKISISPTPDE